MARVITADPGFYQLQRALAIDDNHDKHNARIIPVTRPICGQFNDQRTLLVGLPRSGTTMIIGAELPSSPQMLMALVSVLLHRGVIVGNADLLSLVHLPDRGHWYAGQCGCTHGTINSITDVMFGQDDAVTLTQLLRPPVHLMF